MKRAVTFLLAVVMMLSLSICASAATETKIEKEMIYTTDDLANVEPVGGDWKVEDGVFSLTKEEGGEAAWCQAFIGEETMTDFVIEFDLIQAIDGGILFRASTGENGLNAYMLGSDGLYIYFSKYDDGAYGTMSAPEQKVPGGKNFATQYNQMWDAHWKLVVEGNVFSAYVNGSDEPIIQATDSDFAAGCLGFNYNAALDGEPSMEIGNYEVYKEIKTTVEVPDAPTEPNESKPEDKNDPTDAPAATDPTEPVEDKDPSNAPVGLIVGIAVAAVAIVAVVVVVAKKKKSA